MQQSAQGILRRRLTSAIALPIVLLLLLSGISIGQVMGLLSALQWVDHTDRVIAKANQVQKLLLDVETGSRSYLLTRDAVFLEPFNHGSVQIGPSLNELRNLVADNPEQEQRTNELQLRQIAWLNGANQVFDIPSSDLGRLHSVLLSRKREMDEMRNLITSFIATEEQLRDHRVLTVDRTTRSVIASSVVLAMAIGIILAYFSWLQLRKVSHTYTMILNSLEQSLDERKRTEEDLRRSQERFRRAILDAPLPIMLHTETGEVIQINRQWMQITGYTLQDISTIADWTERAYGERRDLVRAEIERLYNLESSLAEGEFAITTHSGEKRIWEFFSSVVGALTDGHKLVISTAIDITKRKQAEEKIHRSAQRLAALQEIDRAILRLESPSEIAQAALSRLLQVIKTDRAAVLIFDLESGELEVLAGQIDGQTPGSARSITDYISSTALQQREPIWYVEDLATSSQQVAVAKELLNEGYRSFVAAALKGGNNFTGDLLLAKREPHAFSAEDLDVLSEVANQLAIAIQQSQLRHQLQSYAAELEQRVTERTAELESTNRELEAFTYSVSHDLRAPLRTMQGFAQALLEDYGEQLDDIGKTYIDSIVEDAMQMSGLIADLLSYSRLSRSEINPQPVDLQGAIADALKQLATEIEEKQAKIMIERPLPIVQAHRSTLVQVLANLLSNAMKFVRPETQPHINIYTKEELCDRQPWIKLWIEDNGIGIAPEHQERIFRVFERLHGVETYPGTGIGLAIVRKGLERMGGKAGVESQLERGSRFWLALPKAVLAPEKI